MISPAIYSNSGAFMIGKTPLSIEQWAIVLSVYAMVVAFVLWRYK